MGRHLKVHVPTDTQLELMMALAYPGQWGGGRSTGRLWRLPGGFWVVDGAVNERGAPLGKSWPTGTIQAMIRRRWLEHTLTSRQVYDYTFTYCLTHLGRDVVQSLGGVLHAQAYRPPKGTTDGL